MRGGVEGRNTQGPTPRGIVSARGRDTSLGQGIMPLARRSPFAALVAQSPEKGVVAMPHRLLSGRILPRAALALVAILPLAGTARANSARTTAHAPIIIGYLVKTLVNPYFVAMQPVAQAEASKLGVKLVYEAGKYDGDTATQISQIDDLITQGAKAIVLIPSISAGIVPAVKRATAKGITVIALDTATDPPSAVTAFYATDNYEAGVLNGLWARKAFQGMTPKIALLEGTPGSEVNSDRMGGFLAGFGLNARQ